MFTTEKKMSIKQVQDDAREKMHSSLNSLKNELSKVRSGRAHAGLFDQIQIDYYGTMTPLSQVATVSVLDSQTLSVTPWDKKLVAVVDKAVRESDLGLNPAVNGDAIRVPMPPLTEERRRELVKVVKSHTESCKISIRNIRRDANNRLKDLLKGKTISEDDERRAASSVQELTNLNISEAEKIFSVKRPICYRYETIV